jgi:Coenzyme PQQ synthesis protein D (PqqD)
VNAPAHVLIRVLDKESVLLNLETERYFGLDAVGTRMWQVLTSAPSIETAFETLSTEYDAEPGLLRQNVSDLVDRFVENGLLQVIPADVQTTSTV